MKPDVREQLIRATMQLLEEDNRTDHITMRQIAEKADVGLGLINYHFKTRDALINEAIGQMMFNATKPYLSIPAATSENPAEVIKTIFRTNAEIGTRYSLARFTVKYALLQGNMEVPALIVPLIRQYFGSNKTELEIRLMAFSMVTAIQVAYIRSEAFRLYAGIDLHNENQRNQLIDLIVDQYLNLEEK